MNEFNIKFNLDSPQDKNTEIEISMDMQGEYLYKFLSGYEGKWNTLSEFSENKSIKWTPDEYGVYSIMVQIKGISSSKPFDYISKAEYEVKKAEKKFNPGTKVIIDEIEMEKSKSFIVGETIHVKVLASGSNNIKYSFIVSKDGQKLEEIKYGSCSWVDFTPEITGSFQLEVRVKDKFSTNEYDSFRLISMEVLDFIPAQIEYILIPLRENYIISQPISLETIVQNTHQVLVKYILKINGHIIEETDFVENKKYIFVPKCSGIYSVEVLARNSSSSMPFDSRKEIRVRVHEYDPVVNPEIKCDKDIIKSGSLVTFTANCSGGQDMVYEFLIMENGVWELVQSYSKKNYYMLVSFNKGSYKILALMKSSTCKLPYENYCIYSFDIE